MEHGAGCDLSRRPFDHVQTSTSIALFIVGALIAIVIL